MAFEVFDDVAFYWFAQVVLGLFLLPWTVNRLYNWFFSGIRRYHRGHCGVETVPEYLPKIRLIEDRKLDSKLTLSNITFAALWVLFILCLIQLPRFNRREMTDFEPFKILEIERSATANQIRRAYRKLSLKNHPDKGGDEQKFMLIRKAYEALTDETKKENYAKYGNPDGYSGQTVTIGLPIWLARKDNELAILLGYFSVLVILVALVAFWWAHSGRYHKSGVYKKTIDIYWRFTKMSMNIRQLVDILAASAEYRQIDISIPEVDVGVSKDGQSLDDAEKTLKYKSLMDLKVQVDQKTNQQDAGRTGKPTEGLASTPYVYKTATLLLAHLLGLDIPQQLEEHILFVLQEAPRLLDVMIDMTLSRERYFTQALFLINLKQALIQGFLPHESRLRQLPGWTKTLDEHLKKLKCPEITDLAKRSPDELKGMLREAFALSDEQTKEGNEVESVLDVETRVVNAFVMVRMYPFIRIGYCVRTYDEDYIYVNDVVTVTVDVERLLKPYTLADDELHPKVIPAPETEGKDSTEGTGDEDEDELHFVSARMNDDQRLQLARLNANTVHANRFPFQMKEKWMVILVHRIIRFVGGRPDRQIEEFVVIDQKAIPALNGTERVNLHFRAAAEPGKYDYAILIQCDSYIGADQQVQFELVVQPEPEAQTDEEDEEKFFDDDDEDEEWNPKWYYLYNESFWEFLLTLFLLYFIWLIIISSGPGKKYVQPIVDWLNVNCFHPVYDVMAKAFRQVLDPVVARIHESTGFDIPQNWAKATKMFFRMFGASEDVDPRDEL